MKVHIQGKQPDKKDSQEGTPSQAAVLADARPEMLAQRKLLQTIRQSSPGRQVRTSSQTPVQMKQIMLFYRGGTVARVDSTKLSLSQLQGLLSNPDVHPSSKAEVQEAIEAGEYLGTTSSKTTFAPPRSMPLSIGGMSNMGPPPPRTTSSGELSMQAPPFKSPQPMGMMPPPPRVAISSGGRGTPTPMPTGSPSPGGFRMPMAPPGRMPRRHDPNAAPPGPMVLYRGVHSAEQAQQIAKAGSAGGITPDSGAARPSELQVIGQVGMDETAPWASSSTPFKKQDVVEFTTSITTAQDYGSRGGIIQVQIDGRYLSRGDIGASGWICLRSAPLTFLRHIS